MAVVGVAEVLIRPSFADFQKELGAMVDKTLPENSPKNPGSVWADRIKNGLKVTAGAGLAAAGAFMATSLTKGFSRLQNIENAEAKLRGLGHSTESVAKIMESASGAVKGTAFGLDEAATVAASAVAAGVEPGKELQDVLTLVGDAATIAGTDMGSMGAIFNKVKSSNKLQMDSINQLHDAGIPALQLVAQELGVTAEEASKMASEGEIDFATFQRAMTEGMGGAAQESGKTLQGAMANSLAAMGRFGANLLSGVYPQVQKFFMSFQEWMGPVEEMGVAIGEKIGSALAGFAEFIVGTVIPAVSSFVDWIRQVWPVLGPLVIGVGTAVTTFLALKTAMEASVGAFTLVKDGVTGVMGAMKAHPVLLVIAAIAALVAGLIYAYQHSETFRNFVNGMWAGITAAAAAAWAWLQPIFQGIADWVTGTLVPAFVNFWQGVMVPAWAGIVAAVSAAGQFLGGIFQGIVGWVTGTLVPAIMGFWQNVMVPAWAGIVAAVQVAGQILGGVFAAVQAAVGFLAQMAQFYVNNILIPVWSGIVAAVQFMWGIVQPILNFFAQVFLLTCEAIVWAWKTYAWPALVQVGTFFVNLWNSILAPVFAALKAGWDAMVQGLVSAWVNWLLPAWLALQTAAQVMWTSYLAPAFQAVKAGWDIMVRGIVSVWTGLLRPAWDALVQFARTMWTSYLSPAFQAMRDGWSRMVDGIVSFWTGVLRPAWDGAVRFAGTMRDGLRAAFDVIRQKWQDLANGIRSVWQNGIRSVFTALTDFVTKTVPDRVRAGVEAVKSAWRKVANGFREPINWVINRVWNDGVVGTFNRVADTIGSGRRLSRAGTIPAFAEGGFHSGGWALVGEEGPELVNFSAPARIYTASQTAQALSFTDSVKAGVSRAWSGVKSGARAAWDWTKGTLAEGVRKLLSPIVSAASGWLGGKGHLGSILLGVVRSIVDTVTRWATRSEGLRKDRDEEGETLVRDSGGVLPPGLNRVLNATGRDEWVLTGPQLDRLESHVQGSRGGVPSHMVVRIGEREFTGYVEEIGDSRLAMHVAGLTQPVRQVAGV